MLLAKRIPFTYILNKVKAELVYILIVLITVNFITLKFQNLVPEIPFNITAFIGTAISILLSFKLSQSYDRWWEARKVWGSIVNDSRTIVVQIKTLTAPGNETTIRKFALRQIAWCYSLGQSLRGLDPIKNLEEYLDPADISDLEKHMNKPLGMMMQHGNDIAALKKSGQLDVFSQLQIDETLVRLVDSQGKAERIKNTVFPVTYRLFLHFIIYLFVIFLSISLKDMKFWFEIPLLVLISVSFFLLEKSATHMQDPFENRPTDTSMTSIARSIEINIKQLIREDNIPEPLKPNDFYIL
jgi:ion channel-forming bestrophin family protein